MRSILLLILFAPLLASSQIFTSCIDTNRINPFYVGCPDAVFNPVCGCDGNTYRNDCIAFNRYGVNEINFDGVCPNDLFFFDFWPNLTANGFTLHLLMAKPQRRNLEVRVIDAYGKQKFQRLLNNVPNDQFTQLFIDAGAYEPGVYFVMVIGADIARIKKFVKMKDG